jgi:hypothetical protein
MKSEILKRITTIGSFNEVNTKLGQLNEQSNIVFSSALYGATKSLLTLRISETEDQIVLLLPDSKSAEEIFVELNLLDLKITYFVS